MRLIVTELGKELRLTGRVVKAGGEFDSSELMGAEGEVMVALGLAVRAPDTPPLQARRGPGRPPGSLNRPKFTPPPAPVVAAVVEEPAPEPELVEPEPEAHVVVAEATVSADAGVIRAPAPEAADDTDAGDQIGGTRYQRRDLRSEE